MSEEEEGRKILLICIVVVFISISIDYFLLPQLSSNIGGFLLFGLFFYLTYSGYNWSRICLFIMLLISGLGGAYAGVMIKYWYSAGILILIMSLLKLSIAFILLLNKAVKAFVNREMKKIIISRQSIHEIIKWLTCEEKIGKGARRLLIVLSIPFFFIYIIPGILFWLFVRIVLWIIDGFKQDTKRKQVPISKED
ncbi:MAG: hypothetical protein ABIJ52_15390 [Pseudomonadota bacterium]